MDGEQIRHLLSQQAQRTYIWQIVRYVPSEQGCLPFQQRGEYGRLRWRPTDLRDCQDGEVTYSINILGEVGHLLHGQAF